MYQVREVVIKNELAERKRLVIEFDDPAQAIVGEFLMTDASLVNFSVLDDLNKVLSGQSNYVKSSGNRCSLEIRFDQTLIEDLLEGQFTGMDTLQPYEIDTIQLKNLVVMWKEKVEAIIE